VPSLQTSPVSPLWRWRSRQLLPFVTTRLAALLIALVLLLAPSPATALSAASFPAAPPDERVLDEADVLSRAAITEINRQLEGFQQARIDARLITVKQLDYGLSLEQLGKELLNRWSPEADPASLLLFLIDSQTNSVAVVASPSLGGQLSEDLLRSTARTTMALPIREGARFRQASLDGISRIHTVLEGADDPGEPATAPEVAVVSNVPSREETASSNAFTWVVVLLVVGTIVPMLTWWVFSR
jgi:uncharacterized protein